MPIVRDHPSITGAQYFTRLPSEPRFDTASGVDVTVTLDKLYVSGVGTGTTTVLATIVARDIQGAAISKNNVSLAFLPATPSVSAGTVSDPTVDGDTYTFTVPINITLAEDPDGDYIVQRVLATVVGGGGRSGRGTAQFFLNTGRPGTVNDLTAVPWIRGVRLTWSTPQTYTPNEALSYYLFRKPEGPNSAVPTLTRTEVKALIGTAQDPADEDLLRLYKVTGNSYFDAEDDYSTTFYYWLISVDLFGNVSDFPESPMALASPGHVEDTDFQQGSIDIAAIAERDSVPNALAAGTVTTTKLGVLNVAYDANRFKSSSRLTNGSGTVATSTTPVSPGAWRVVGTSTAFTSQVTVGDLIVVAGRTAEVTAITNNGSLDVAASLGTNSGQSYKIIHQTPGSPYVAWGAVALVRGSIGSTFVVTADPGESTNNVLYWEASSGTIVGRNRWDKTVSPTGTGTLSIAKDSTTVTGVGTQFLTQVRVGDFLVVDGANYKVLSIESNTSLTLASGNAPKYAVTAQAYKIRYATAPAGTYEGDFVSGVDLLIGFNKNGTFKPSMTGTFISGDYIQTGTIEANKIDINELSALTANIGDLRTGIIRNVENGETTAIIRLGGATAPALAQNANGQPLLEGTLVRRVLDMAASTNDVLAVGGANNRFLSVVDTDGTDKFYITASGAAVFSGIVNSGEAVRAPSFFFSSSQGTIGGTSPDDLSGSANLLTGTFATITANTAQIKNKLVVSSNVNDPSTGVTLGSYTLPSPGIAQTRYATITGAGSADLTLVTSAATSTTGPQLDTGVPGDQNASVPNNGFYTLTFTAVMDLTTFITQQQALYNSGSMNIIVEQYLGTSWVQVASIGMYRILYSLFQYDSFTTFWTPISNLPSYASVIDNGFTLRVAALTNQVVTFPAPSPFPLSTPPKYRLRLDGTVSYDSGLTKPPIAFRITSQSLSWQNTPTAPISRVDSVASYGGFLYLKPVSTDPATGALGELTIVSDGNTTIPKFYDGTNWVSIVTGTGGSISLWKTATSSYGPIQLLKLTGTAVTESVITGTTPNFTGTVTINTTRINGSAQDITLGSGLSLSGGVLTATASGGVTSIGGATGAVTLGNGLQVSGTTNGSVSVKVDGSTISFNGSGQLVAPGSGVSSVNGRTGAITLTAADVAAGTFPTGTFTIPSGSNWQVWSSSYKVGGVRYSTSNPTGGDTPAPDGALWVVYT